MLASLIFASLAVGVAALPAPSEEPADLHRSFAHQDIYRRDNITIDVYVHVGTPQDPDSPWNLSAQTQAQTVEKQVGFLNERFNSIGFFFNLLDTEWWIYSSDWLQGNDQRVIMASRRGNSTTLNLLYKPSLEGGLDGYSTHPSLLNTSWEAPGMDGCIMRVDKMSGFSYGMLGTTTVLKVGHWLGLVDRTQPSWRDIDDGTGTPRVGEMPNCRGGPDEPCLADFTDRQADRMRFYWGLRVQLMAASELQPLTPVEAAGKLPFYPEPSDKALFYRKCEYEVFEGLPGVERRENYCGSKHFCHTRGWAMVWEQTNRTRYSDEEDCLSARADPGYAQDVSTRAL